MKESKDIIERREGQVEEFKMSLSYTELTEIDGETIEFEWNMFPGFSSLHILQEIQNDLRQHGTWNLTNLQTGSSSYHSSTTLIGQKGNDEICRCEFRKSQGIREEILPRTLDVSWSWRRKLVWNSSLRTWRKMTFDSHSNGGKIQRYTSSSIQEYQCFESWNSEQEEWQRHHTLQCGCFKHRTLFFRIIHSVKQLSIYGAVSNWCEQFGLTEEE